MSAEDFDKTQGLIEQTNTEEAQPGGLLFEILMSSTASEWPPSCEGVKGVLTAVQKMLYSAAAGAAGPFLEATFEVEDAMDTWSTDLFGEKP